MLSATYEDGKTIEYTYDNSGRTATISDEASGTVSSFGYDYMDRVSVYTEENPDNKLSLSYSYYVANKKLKTLLEEINGHPRGASYIYDNDERLESYQKANGKREYTYDKFDRVPSYVTKHKNSSGNFDTVLTTAFNFVAPTESTTSNRVSSMTQSGNGFTNTYSYTYDNNGNVSSATDGNGTTTYVYDSQGQLLRENNFAGNFTHVWEYDDAGNILSRKEYAYTTGAISENTVPLKQVDYEYEGENPAWGDLLSKYDGQEIKYDEIGNPETIGSQTLTWRHGKQLASLTNGQTTWTYTCNADGLRTKRTDGTNTYEYVYYGGLLQYMEYNGTAVYLTHTPDGSPMGMLTGGQAYFYVLNLQGDVVGIVDATGNLVVSYTYDAWGNLLSCTGTLANTIGALNPLRYRGYVYDAETNLYYLQTRYYSAEIGRFISADIFASTGQGLTGQNMFAYCGNNPVCRTDITGQAWWHWVAAAAVVVAAAAAVVITAGGAAAAVAAVTCVASGVAATSTAATVAAGVFIGSSTALAVSTYAAAVESDSAEEFANHGEAALYNTVGGGVYGGVEAYGLTKPACPSKCFVAGTLVHTSNGTEEIENIKVGDIVWAWDEETGDVALKEVVETYVNETTELVHVFVGGEEIITTPTHPFYSPVKGWTDAVRLRAGDILVLVNGEYVVVEKVQHEILETSVTVYNFQVRDHHTYYISATGILVHNACKNQQKFSDDQQAVLDLAKEHKQGVTRKEAEILVDFANEYGIANHPPMTHPGRSGYWSNRLHIKIKNLHLPILE